MMMVLTAITTLLTLGLAIIIWRNDQPRPLNFVDLVARLDAITARATAMAKLAEHVTDPELLKKYQASLIKIENTLSSFSRLNSPLIDLNTLKGFERLTRDCQRSLKSSETALKKHLRQKSINYKNLFQWKPKEGVKGCYFCSRPNDAPGLKSVKSRIHGVTIRVWGCEVCCNQLRKNRKVKVLYFLINGQPIHWTQVRGYQPSENFWGLNSPQKKPKPPLKLVYSEARQSLFDRRTND